jgi:hypothetical protein
MKYVFFWVSLIVLLSLTSCGKFEGDLNPCIQGQIYGFWYGLWHGFISPISLVVSLFDETVKMFAPNNNGGWYALGYLFGSGGWGIMASKTKVKTTKSH